MLNLIISTIPLAHLFVFSSAEEVTSNPPASKYDVALLLQVGDPTPTGETSEELHGQVTQFLRGEDNDGTFSWGNKVFIEVGGLQSMIRPLACPITPQTSPIEHPIPSDLVPTSATDEDNATTLNEILLYLRSLKSALGTSGLIPED